MKRFVLLFLLLVSAPAWAQETTVTLKFPDAMIARITSAKNSWNVKNGKTLTNKEWTHLMVIEAVRVELATTRTRATDESNSALADSERVGWSTCGNNDKEYDEECDDGNTTPGDACSATCKVE